MERGGARQGAGRKPKALQELKRQISVNVLSSVDEIAEWKKLFHDAKEKRDDYLRFRILAYHSDQKYGRAPQRIVVTGDEDADPVKVLLIGEAKHGRRG